MSNRSPATRSAEPYYFVARDAAGFTRLLHEELRKLSI